MVGRRRQVLLAVLIAVLSGCAQTEGATQLVLQVMFEPEPFLSSLPYVRQEGGLRLDEENRTSWTPSSVSIHFGDRDDDLRVDRVEEFVHYVYWGRECRIHRVNESAERAVAFTGISIAVEDEPHGWRFAPPCTGGFTFGPLSVER